jgi:hypothetical protein
MSLPVFVIFDNSWGELLWFKHLAIQEPINYNRPMQRTAKRQLKYFQRLGNIKNVHDLYMRAEDKCVHTHRYTHTHTHTHTECDPCCVDYT